MIDHISLSVSDFETSKAFFASALQPLGYTLIMEFPGVAGVAGFGIGGKPDFWIHQAESVTPIHVAFASNDRATVDRFFEAGIAAGGRDNGGPGLRSQYHPSYYGAFVLDGDGHNIEAVCHLPGTEG